MNKKVRISDLSTYMDERYYEDLEMENRTDLKPSEKRIEDLVFRKLHETETPASHQTETPVRRKNSFPKKAGHILLVAAIVGLFATTVFAAAGGFDYFRSIFGDSAHNVENSISNPMSNVRNDDYSMTLESLLTDGYKIDLVVSLEKLSKGAFKGALFDEPLNLFETELMPPPSKTSGQESVGSYTVRELNEFSTSKKRYYYVELDNMESSLNRTLTLSLNPELADLELETLLEGAAAAKVLTIGQTLDGGYTIETIQLSQLGVMVIGKEDQASGGLPAPQIDIVFKDGSHDELISAMSFDSGDGETVLGGGGVVIGADPSTGPLVTGTMGQRNPDGKVVTTGEFGRAVNLDEVASILVDGTEYPVN